MNTQRFCRTDFRLHGMDMWPQAHVKADLHHWMLREGGGDPLDGAAVSPATPASLPSHPEPTTTWAALKSCARIARAFARKCWRGNGQILRLQGLARRARDV